MTTLHKSSPQQAKNLSRLIKQRALLLDSLKKVDNQITQFPSKGRSRGTISATLRERLLDELASGPPNTKSLPKNFSRADIYDDHD